MKTEQTMSKYIAIALLSFLSLSLNAQINATGPKPELPSIVPPSPTVANLMKFEEVPVDNYSGQPDISIPMLSKSIGSGLTLNAVLKYNTQGIKIENRSGMTGTGWSMETGGVISRTIRGVADEEIKIEGHPTKVATGIYHLADFWNFANILDSDQKKKFVWNAAGNKKDRYDTEPDLYQFSMLGISGRFIVVKEGGQLVAKLLSSEQKFIIDLDYDHTTFAINWFTITDASGNKFYFDVKETTHTYLTTITYPRNDNPVAPDPSHPETDHVTAWHLKTIKGSTGQELAKFEYIESEEHYRDAPNVTEYYFKKSDLMSPLMTNAYNRSQFRPNSTFSLNEITMQTQKLALVKFRDSTRFAFTYSEQGTHPETNGVYLKNATYIGGLRSYQLTYETIATRLYLKTVSENGLVSTIKYHDRENLPPFFVSPNAMAVSPSDAFGYNVSYFPGRSSQGINLYQPENLKKGLLDRIVFPTGGVKQFIFEPHTYSWQGSQRLHDTIYLENPLNLILKQTPERRLKIENTYSQYFDSGVWTNDFPDEFPQIKIDHRQPIYFDVTLLEDNCIPDLDCINLYDLLFREVTTGATKRITLHELFTSPNYPSLILPQGTYAYKLTGSFTDNGEPTSNGPGQPVDGTLVDALVKIYYTEANPNYQRYMIGGGLRIKDVVFKDNDEVGTAASRKFSYSYNEPAVTTTNPEEDPDIIDLEEGSGTGSGSGHMHPNSYFNVISPYSSGAIDTRIDNLQKMYTYTDRKYLFLVGPGLCEQGENKPGCLTWIDFDYIVKQKSPNIELTKGNYIGYKHVKVSEQGNGWTESMYLSARDYPTPNWTLTYPFKPAPNLDYRRGLLKESRILNNEGNKLKETINDYDFSDETQAQLLFVYEQPCEWKQFYDYYDSYKNHTPEEWNHIQCATNPLEPSNSPLPTNYVFDCFGTEYGNCTAMNFPFVYEGYPMSRGWAKLTETVSKDYLYDGTETKEVTTTAAYDYNEENYQLNQQETTLLRGGVATVYKTTNEFPVGGYTTAFYDTTENNSIGVMVSKNIVNAPLVTRSYKDGELLNTLVNKYNGDGTLKAVQTAKAGEAREDRILYSAYDQAGNPGQVSKAGGTPITYVWGYHRTLPIAKLENVSMTDLWAVLEPGQPMHELPDEDDLDEIEALRNNPAFATARITTFSHIPGVGVSTITDLNGKTTTFTYDDFGRLLEVVDADNKIVSRNNYHYTDTSDATNWVQTTTFNEAVTYSPLIETGEAADKTINKTFLDGLGRPIQTIAHKQAGDGGDIISFMKYDALGRQPKAFLPYTRTTPSLSADGSPESSLGTFYSTTYTPSTAYPFSETDFEHSPLGRPEQQSAPGESWNKAGGHTVKTAYETNGVDEVRLFTATVGHDPNTTTKLYDPSMPGGNAYYLPGELYKTIVKDENWAAVQTYVHEHTTEEFKNPEGQVVLKRTYNDNTPYDTYYVYDQYGNLTYVIPPAVTIGSSGVTQAQLDGLCYQYKYDYRSRMAEKKLPGKQWEYIVYDNLDRVVATGPAFWPYTTATQPTGWTITKYDAFDRVAYTAWYPSSSNFATMRKSMQNDKINTALYNESKTTSGSIDAKTVYYTNNIAPTAVKLLTVNYYDNYNYPNVSAMQTAVDGQAVTTATKGLLTGQWLKVYGLMGSMKGNIHTYFYDTKNRQVQKYTTLYISGGYRTYNTKYDFIGRELSNSTTMRLATGGTAVGFVNGFVYDAQHRLQYRTFRFGSGATQLMAYNSYDKLGQLTGKKVGGTSLSGNNCLQNVNYSYNIRGWMTGINDTGQLQKGTDPKDLFAFKINYNSPTGGVADALYNGNISETHWITTNDEIPRMYSYGYDGLNRLLDATFQKESEGAINDYYGEHITGYDKNGNIQGLERYGGVNPSNNEPMKIDHLIYGYNGLSPNQLAKVDEATDGNAAVGFKDVANTIDYVYDANGNMVKDFNKGIGTGTTDGIIYNHLNLPMKITFANGDKIEYFYQADGVKVQKVVTQGSTVTTTDYVEGGIQFTNNVFDFVPTAEGYVKNTVVNGTNTYSYVYNYTDHLGNVRLSYAKSPSNVLTILEENNYYPFGMKHQGYNNDGYVFGSVSNALALVFNGAKSYQYQYNGKEFQGELGLDWSDYGARNYDASIGRWMNVDPLAEKYRRWSPYNYCVDNPMRFVDPDGMGVNDVIVSGPLKDKAFAQLQAATQNLNLSMDDNGKVTATAKEGVKLTDAEKTFQTATTDEKRIVKLNATDSNFNKDGSILIGGHFEGSKKKGEKVTASQTVNPNQMDVIDAATSRGEGVGTLHEVLEAYSGAVNSPGAKPATDNNTADYDAAHADARATDPRHKEISGTSPNTRPYVLPNGDGTFQIEKYIEYNQVKTLLFKEKSVKQ